VNQFLELKLKINEAQVAISRAALEEENRENDVNYSKMLKKKEWWKKRSEAEQEVEAKGLSKDKLYLNRNALKKEEEEKPDESFGWNVYGEEAYYKAYHKRCGAIEIDSVAYQEQMNGGITKPSEDALNKLQQDITKQYSIPYLDSKSERPSAGGAYTTKTRR
jgi:calcium/calmodulin-dependent protein kinase (CaM kinase) II/peptidyl-prolyl isomerase G (cyclophilin G)